MITPIARLRIRFESSRPLLIAVGPRAQGELAIGHGDLELVDVLLIDEDPAVRAHGPDVLERFFGERSVIVCLFDARDETRWSVVALLADIARGQTSTTLIVAVCDPRPRSQAHDEMLTRLARRLGACVIPTAPGALLRSALSAVAGLLRSGLTGFDPGDFAMVLQAPSVGRVSFIDASLLLGDEPERPPATAPQQLITVRCGADISLNDINSICGRILGDVAAADLMIATPFVPGWTLCEVELLEVFPVEGNA